MRLINRKPAVELESLASLLDRLGIANYYEVASWYRTLLPPPVRPNPNWLRAPAQFAVLTDLTGIPTEALYNMTLHRFARSYYMPEQLADGPLPYWPDDVAGEGASRDYVHGKGDYSKVCPLCWRDNAVLLLPWALRHVTTCLKHEVLLVDKCTKCGEMLNLEQRPEGIDEECSHCHTSVGDMAVVSIAADQDSIDLATLVWNALGLTTLTPTVSKDSPALNIPSARLLDFMRRVPPLLFRFDPQTPLFSQQSLPAYLQTNTNIPELRLIDWKWGSDVLTTHVVLRGMWRLLRDWPAEWHSALLRIAAIESTKANAGKRFPMRLAEAFPRAQWPWLYKGLESFLGTQVLKNKHLYTWLNYYRTAQAEAPKSAGMPRMLSQNEAARELGMSAATLKRHIADGTLVTTPSPGRGHLREWALIEAESIARLREYRQSLLSLAQAATMLGVSEEQVPALCEAGMVRAEKTPKAGESPVWGFTTSDLSNATETLLYSVPGKEIPARDPDAISLADAVRIGSFRGVRLPQMLRAAQEGELSAYHDPSRAQTLGLHALWMARGSLLNWLAGCNQPTGRKLLTAEQVRILLRCKPETLRKLAAAKLLVPFEEKASGKSLVWRYDVTDVDAFRTRYITADLAAVVLGVNKLTAQRWAKSGRISAVTGPDIDGSHAYRFDRAALEEWRAERMTVGEAARLMGVNRTTIHRWMTEGRIQPLEGMGGKQSWFSRQELLALDRKGRP